MKFLFFEMKSVCYNSYVYFANSISNELIKAGHQIDMFRLSEESFEALERFEGKSYDAIFDFNSDLPRATEDDGSYFLDLIDGPFYNIILDHPLYHHDSLKHKLKNYHVICMDEFHKEYIKKYYPHIKSVHVVNMTGEAYTTTSMDFYERPIDLLFSGTYTNPNLVINAIESIPTFLKKNTYELIELMEADPQLSIDMAVEKLALNEKYDYIKDDFPLHTQSFYLADAYMRAQNRNKIIKAIDNAHLPLHLCGALWDTCGLSDSTTIHGELNFNLSFKMFSQAKIVLNIMPGFKSGIHDRVFSTMLNGAVCLTDESLSLSKSFDKGKEILFYDVNSPDGLVALIKNSLCVPEQLKDIAQTGHTKANKYYTWKNVCDYLLENVLV